MLTRPPNSYNPERAVEVRPEYERIAEAQDADSSERFVIQKELNI
jgi:hypothetical protein